MHASNTYRTARQVFCPFKLFQNYFSLFREGRSESPCVLTRPGMQNLRIVGLEKLPWKTRLREKTSRVEGGGGEPVATTIMLLRFGWANSKPYCGKDRLVITRQ